eukprot:scaffold2114_cov253-Pinguiococcus_pyrenoidosus.AAC.25
MARVPTTMFTACVALGIRSARPFPRALRRSTLTMQSSRHSFDALGAGDEGCDRMMSRGLEAHGLPR